MIKQLMAMILCTVILNPDGWLGWFSDPRRVEYEVGAWWQIYAADGTLTLQAITQRDANGLPLERAKISYRRDQWVTYSCVGCSQVDEVYGCQ